MVSCHPSNNGNPQNGYIQFVTMTHDQVQLYIYDIYSNIYYIYIYTYIHTYIHKIYIYIYIYIYTIYNLYTHNIYIYIYNID